eukprot:224330-Pleurochrysis_carterae.AAC.2
MIFTPSFSLAALFARGGKASFVNGGFSAGEQQLITRPRSYAQSASPSQRERGKGARGPGEYPLGDPFPSPTGPHVAF